MADGDDFYQILGVPRDASQQDASHHAGHPARRGADLRGPVPGTDRQAHRAGPGTMFPGLTTGILPGPAAGRIPRSARPRRDY